MALIDFIKNIETKYDVGSIYLNDIQLWPILRYHYIFRYEESLRENNKNNNNFIIKLKKIISNFKYVFYLPFLIKFIYKYEYLIITYNNQLREINGILVNTLTDNIIKNLDSKKVLVFEGYKKDNGKIIRKTKVNSINLNLIKIFSGMIPVKNNYKIINEQILKDINNEYGLHVNYEKIFKKYIKYDLFLEFIIRNNNLKGIFIQDSYNLFSSALIRLAHRYNIRTIEIQHGVVNASHHSYNIFVKMKQYFYPEYFLSFGDNEKKVFDSNNNFINKDHVIPIGNMYVDYIKKHYKPKNNIIKRFNKLKILYDKIVSISSQIYNEDKLITFIMNSSKLSNKILYIYVPRIYNKDKYEVLTNYKNIVLMNDLNVYQIIKESDFHSTMFSTCALEAPAIGIPNILINIDDLSKSYYGDILDEKNTKYVNDEKEYVNTILNWNISNIEKNDYFYKTNYYQNIKKALNIIFKDNIKVNL